MFGFETDWMSSTFFLTTSERYISFSLA